MAQIQDPFVGRVAAELGIAAFHVARTIALLDEKNTIPFIARYRKEVTGGLDEVLIEAVERRMAALRALEARRGEVLAHIQEQGKLTPDLQTTISSATSLQALEDLYLPYRPKRHTRAMIARERGLAPLAKMILAQVRGMRTDLARPFLRPDGEVLTIEDALAGARDIVAETIAEDAELRGALRDLFAHQGTIAVCQGDPTSDEMRTYAQYYDFSGAIASLPPYRVLAINRGEHAGALKVTVTIAEESVTAALERRFPADDRSALAADLRRAADDGYDRLLAPSLERELRAGLTVRAETHAVEVFGANLRPLLLQPPLRGRTVIGIDPGFRTGCKIAVVDETGKPLALTTIFPHPPQGRWAEARSVLGELVRTHSATVFAVGSGTAGRETEMLIAELIATLDGDYSYAMVDEAGASVYSVSELAREEFPDLDATQRGAISIARRLQDPLAELVKVEPRAVGVGLYQHDVAARELTERLDRVVESAVTFAGVDVNTASAALLRRVAGLNRGVAAAIVRYRQEHGKFTRRVDLLKVPGLGPRAFQQAAGFLQIHDGTDPLDRTFIHPESYTACLRLIAWLPDPRPGESLPSRAARLIGDLAAHPSDSAALARELGIGEPTLADILDNLARPGLDPRASLPAPLLRTAALSPEDLREGMVLQGTVRNVVDFGAFVDIGLKQAGLVHVSELAARFVRSPLDVVQVGQVVSVRVLGVDAARGRISLSMRPVHS